MISNKKKPIVVFFVFVATSLWLFEKDNVLKKIKFDYITVLFSEEVVSEKQKNRFTC